jgi:DNA gyrase subunit B
MSQIENYGVKDIKTLEGIEAIRLRPGMYIGSTGPEGVRHITLEIISNAVDEYLNGHCTKCIITVDKDNNIEIRDNGRGVPFGKAEDGSETLVNVYTKLHTGAKFDSNGKTGYNTSGGMNGVGAKATNALSEQFQVSSVRDGKHAVASFAKGKLISYEEEKWSGKETGTWVKFRPDKEIFKEGITLDYATLRNQLQELAYLSPGMVFELNYQGNETDYITSQNGIRDYINDLNNKKNTLTSVFYTESLEERLGVKVAMQYNEGYSDTYKLYTNSIPNSGGTHLTGFRTALTSTINSYARDKGLLKEKDNNITGEELKEGLTLVLSFIMPDPVFSGQTKDVLSSSEARTIVQRLVSAELETWLLGNPKDAKAIVDKALLARAAREKAKKAKDAVRNIESKKQKALKFDSKLADCYSKNRAKCELYITEGDSASGNLKTARDNEFQAVLPIRGKILNTQKATLDKIQKNAEIMTMIEAFGLGIDTKTMKVTYNPDNLRYDKIIIMSDADVDGAHIKNLFYTFIWNFCPELIFDGHIYAGVPPLYKITIGKEYKYLKNDEALEEFRKAHQGRKYIVNRLKGLGEMSEEETEETLTDPNNRIIRQVTVEDAAAAGKLFDDLMGQAITPRKNYIKAHSKEAIGNV